LYTGLLGGSLVAILFFRFIYTIKLAELAGWLAFLFLQVYPR
jgi:hypothetical protein